MICHHATIMQKMRNFLWLVSEKIGKNPCLTLILLYHWINIFFKNWAVPLFLLHHSLTSCKISEKSNEQSPSNLKTDERTDGWTGAITKDPIRRTLGPKYSNCCNIFWIEAFEDFYWWMCKIRRSFHVMKFTLWRHISVKSDGMVVKLGSLHFHNIAMRFAKFRHFLTATFWFIEIPSFKSRQIPMSSSVPLHDRLMKARQKN